MIQTNPARLSLVAATALLLGLAACGGDEEPEGTVDAGASVEATGTLEEAVIPDSLQGVAPAAPGTAPE